MSFIGKLVNSRGKEHYTFSSKAEAKNYCETHGASGYNWVVKPITVYVAVRKYKNKKKR